MKQPPLSEVVPDSPLTWRASAPKTVTPKASLLLFRFLLSLLLAFLVLSRLALFCLLGVVACLLPDLPHGYTPGPLWTGPICLATLVDRIGIYPNFLGSKPFRRFYGRNSGDTRNYGFCCRILLNLCTIFYLPHTISYIPHTLYHIPYMIYHILYTISGSVCLCRL